MTDNFIRHATLPEFTCRVVWEVRCLGVWDNRQVIHPIAINGDVPFGLEEAEQNPKESLLVNDVIIWDRAVAERGRIERFGVVLASTDSLVYSR